MLLKAATVPEEHTEGRMQSKSARGMVMPRLDGSRITVGPLAPQTRSPSLMNQTAVALSVAAGLALTGVSTLQAQSVQPATGTVSVFDGMTRGGALLRSLSQAQLADLAAKNDLQPEQAAQVMRNDHSLWVNSEGRFVYVCPLAPEGDEEASFAARGTIPLDQAFFLNSRPGASKTIYLDFDGHQSVNNSWNHNITFPPYDTSGSSATFTDSELQQIIDTWEQVAEDFAPFDVNVTTQDPGVNALRKSSGSDQQYGVRCLMTQATGGFGNGIGGVAFLGSFDDSIDNPVFAFNKGVLNGAMTASHEVGHALGLFHDGLNSSEYHPGSSQGGATGWGPIMGAPFNRNLTQWSNGDYSGSTATQNDVVIITNSANGINYLPDDHTGNFFLGTELGNGVPVSGVIDRASDTDGFAFTVDCAGMVSIDATPDLSAGYNLDIEVIVYDSIGFIVETINPTTDVSAAAMLSLDAGQYYLSVDGTYRAGQARGPESDYGSIGAYTLTVGSLGTCCPADVNGDGVADPSDFGAWVAAFNAGSASCDQNNDGACTPTDFSAWVANYNAGC